MNMSAHVSKVIKSANYQKCAPLDLRELLVKQANTRTLRSNTTNLLHIPLTNQKRFGDRALCAYAPHLWN